MADRIKGIVASIAFVLFWSWVIETHPVLRSWIFSISTPPDEMKRQIVERINPPKEYF